MASIYKILSRFIPRKARNNIRQYIVFSSIGVDPDSFIGFVILSSILLGLIAGFSLGSYGYPFWVVAGVVFVLFNVIIFAWIALLVDKKAKLVEEALPDALQLMVSNLKSGMTPGKALILSARPEFGPLKDEIDLIGRKVAFGTSVGVALSQMAGRIRSKRLLRAVELINSGLNSGGQLANLLESTSNHLREQFLVDRKIKASIAMYVIFIFSAASVITPGLLALSSYLVDILQSTFSNIDIPPVSSIPISISGASVSVTTEFLVQFLVVFVVATCFMASLILGLIVRGKQREGLRYFMIMAALAVPIFFIVRTGIGTIFSGLFG